MVPSGSYKSNACGQWAERHVSVVPQARYAGYDLNANRILPTTLWERLLLLLSPTYIIALYNTRIGAPSCRGNIMACSLVKMFRCV